MNYLFLDFETAATHHACAIAGIIRTQTHIETFKTLINPRIPATTWNDTNIAIHGIQPKETTNSPTFKQVYKQHLEHRIENHTIIAHNAAFDMSILRKNMELTNLPITTTINYYCTLLLAKKLRPDLPKHTLDYLMSTLNLGTFNHHEPLDDCKASLKVLTHLKGKKTVHQIFKETNLHLGQINPDYSHHTSTGNKPKKKPIN